MKFVRVAVVVVLSFLGSCDATCRELFARGVSGADKNTIVNRHNEIRLAAAQGRISGEPKAANMKRMSWDSKLAREAQKVAETCIFKHVKIHDSRFYVGQNLYLFKSTASGKTPDWKSAINAWYDEYTTYDFGTSQYNHYTQVVWATSKLVGCGFTYSRNAQGWYEKYYVCNYGPGGNIVGETPYRVGQGCENLC